MRMQKWFSPYDGERRIGSVISVGATEATINLTLAGKGEKSSFFGSGLSSGDVDEYIFIDVGKTTVLGRLVKVWLEGGERLSVDSLTTPPSANHPIGLVHLLISVDPSTGKSQRGIQQYPKLGNQVYSAHPSLVTFLITASDGQNGLQMGIAHHPQDKSSIINVSPEKLFSRHCAILGATGGGKSYTVSTLIEQTLTHGGKAILIDPTGEYSALPCESYYLGENANSTPANSLTYPHHLFSDSDIRAFLRPSAQSQAPKLDAAILSQKIVTLTYQIANNQLNITNDYYLVKAGQKKAPFEGYVRQFAGQLHNTPWAFARLADQIVNECLWPNAGTASNPDQTTWGGRAENDVGYCLNLISRIKAYSQNPHLKWMLDANPNLKTVPDVLERFLADDSVGKILRLDLSAIPYEANSRELFVNALGRKLMSLARGGKIQQTRPVVVFIDEAHQFLNKAINEDAGSFAFDSFGNIAKEGRKYGLNLVIATQRPRDIPEDVLSQIGTLIVHRLTNHHDQDTVRRSVGTIDNKSVGFLPTLSQGEALLLGVDFSFPMTVKIKKPTYEPSSKSADYSNYWSAMRGDIAGLV